MIEDLIPGEPLNTDPVSTGAPELRSIKTEVQASFPSLGSTAVTKTAEEINDLVEQTDPVLNGDVSGTALETTITNTDAKLPTSGAVFDKVSGLNIKIVNIGDWNIDADSETTVAHGLTLSKIRSISVIIRNDANNEHRDLGAQTGGTSSFQWIYANATNIVLRADSFANTNYDSTGYNRGWVTIHYTD